MVILGCDFQNLIMQQENERNFWILSLIYPLLALEDSVHSIQLEREHLWCRVNKLKKACLFCFPPHGRSGAERKSTVVWNLCTAYPCFIFWGGGEHWIGEERSWLPRGESCSYSTLITLEDEASSLPQHGFVYPYPFVHSFIKYFSTFFTGATKVLRLA